MRFSYHSDCIISNINIIGGPPMLCESGAKLLSYFEALRKEFKVS